MEEIFVCVRKAKPKVLAVIFDKLASINDKV